MSRSVLVHLAYAHSLRAGRRVLCSSCWIELQLECIGWTPPQVAGCRCHRCDRILSDLPSFARLLAAPGSARQSRAVSESCSVSAANVCNRVTSAWTDTCYAPVRCPGCTGCERPSSRRSWGYCFLPVPLAFSLKWCLGESRLRRASRHVLASAASSVMPTCVLICRLGASRLF